MTDRQRLSAKKALELLRNIDENDSGDEYSDDFDLDDEFLNDLDEDDSFTGSDSDPEEDLGEVETELNSNGDDHLDQVPDLDQANINRPITSSSASASKSARKPRAKKSKEVRVEVEWDPLEKGQETGIEFFSLLFSCVKKVFQLNYFFSLS